MPTWKGNPTAGAPHHRASALCWPPGCEARAAQRFLQLLAFRRQRPQEELRRLSSLTKLAFSQRRKQMGKVLAASYGKVPVENAFAAAGIPWEIRPDRVTPEQFALLAEALA